MVVFILTPDIYSFFLPLTRSLGSTSTIWLCDKAEKIPFFALSLRYLNIFTLNTLIRFIFGNKFYPDSPHIVEIVSEEFRSR